MEEGRKRILVVDDEADILDLLRDLLEGEGYEVDCAPDAARALALVRDRIYDVAIVDFNLPDMDGVMLHRKMREMDGELAEKTVFVSGLVQTEENLGYYANATGGFLAKPFRLDQVLEIVDRMVA